MMNLALSRWALVGLLLFGSQVALCGSSSCPPDSLENAGEILRASKPLNIADGKLRQTVALDLLACLSDPNPRWRDSISFESLSRWMRANELDESTLQAIRERLLVTLNAKADTTDGFGPAFAALTLGEVARTDRIKPWLNEAQREELVAAACRFMENIRDYRGFDETSGWRHAVAHGADLMLQLSLNPAIAENQLKRLRDAIALQILPANNHAYRYGEGERLMAPVFYMARRGYWNSDQWTSWFDALTQRVGTQQPPTQAQLAALHNLKSFALPLYFALQESTHKESRETLLPAVTKMLKRLG